MVPLSSTELLPQKATLQRETAKQSNLRCRKKQKESPKMERQRHNPQSTRNEEYPEKELKLRQAIYQT